MGVVRQEPGRYGGQMFEEVGGQQEGHLGLRHDTWSVVSVGQVGCGKFFNSSISFCGLDHS